MIEASLENEEKFRTGLKLYAGVRIMCTLYNKVFGNSPWLPSLLTVCTIVQPMAVYGILKLGDRLDFVSYTYLCLAVPCIVLINMGLYYPMVGVESNSVKIGDGTQIHKFLTRFKLTHESKKEPAEGSSGGGSLIKDSVILRRKLKFMKTSLMSCQRVQCNLLTFGAVDKKAKQHLLRVLVDLTIYFLLTF